MSERTALQYPIPNDAVLDPPAEWAELRGRCPVAHVTFASGDPATLLTRYEDVKATLADPRFTRTSAEGDSARVSEESGGVLDSQMASVHPQHGEAHLVWRRTLNKWFTAKRMAALRPGVTAMADRLVDEMTAAGDTADLKAAFGSMPAKSGKVSYRADEPGADALGTANNAQYIGYVIKGGKVAGMGVGETSVQIAK